MNNTPGVRFRIHFHDDVERLGALRPQVLQDGRPQLIDHELRSAVVNLRKKNIICVGRCFDGREETFIPRTHKPLFGRSTFQLLGVALQWAFSLKPYAYTIIFKHNILCYVLAEIPHAVCKDC